MHWSRDFVGLPHIFAGRNRDGVDCWGLFWLIYRDVLGISIASYATETMDAPERAQIARLIASDRAVSPWVPVDRGQEREFDMAVFRRGGIEAHVGIVIAPGKMLHIVEGGQSCAETYAAGRWSARLVGLHRHVNRAA